MTSDLAPAPAAPTPLRAAIVLVCVLSAVSVLYAAVVAWEVLQLGVANPTTLLPQVWRAALAVAWVVLVVLVARGRAWARTVLTVLVGLRVLQLLFALATVLGLSPFDDQPLGFPPNATLLVLVDLAVVAAVLVLLWRPVSTAFLRRTR